MAINIYLSGGMSNITYEEQIGWRNRFENDVKEFMAYTGYNQTPVFFSPPKYYSSSTNNHKSEREAMEYDLYRLRKSDVIVVNFNQPNSIGTAMELMLARELHIPIIGINADKRQLHPWLIECCTRICDSMNEAIKHICYYYLN